jgi:biopolymer transport protein TolR
MSFQIGNHNSRKRRASMSDINITPFVDVLLVLLIIFMVAAPMMTGSVEIDLPKGASSSSQSQDEPIAVSIKNDGTIYAQEEPVKLRALPEKLIILTNKNFDSKIFVRADSKIDYGLVMETIKVINLAGFTQVVLVTDFSGN